MAKRTDRSRVAIDSESDLVLGLAEAWTYIISILASKTRA